jgi:hypothetical protein
MISKLLEKYPAPIVIGGVGGSGTRLVAQCLKEAGFYIGSDLNIANDNLWFTLLFKRIEILDSSDSEFDELVDIFFKAMTGSGRFTQAQIDIIKNLASLDRDQHPAKWLHKRANTLLSEQHSIESNTRWGWKEPNSHVVIDRLRRTIPNMKYIHVIRNGLDMAHSTNQSQLKFWGKHFIGSDYHISPFYSLKYWCVVHQRVLEIGNSIGTDFFLLNYDDFTIYPEKGIRELLQFLGLDVTTTQINLLSKLIKIPESIGRFKQYGIKIFDEADVAFVKKLGFVIEIE